MRDYILKKWEFILIMLLLAAMAGVIGLGCEISKKSKTVITIKKI